MFIALCSLFFFPGLCKAKLIEREGQCVPCDEETLWCPVGSTIQKLQGGSNRTLKRVGDKGLQVRMSGGSCFLLFLLVEVVVLESRESGPPKAIPLRKSTSM